MTAQESQQVRWACPVSASLRRFHRTAPVAFDRLDPNGGRDVWLLNMARNNQSRFTFGLGLNYDPVWSPDGGRVAFYSTREGDGNVYVKALRGESQEQVPDKTPGARAPADWSRDGKYIVEEASDPKTKNDIWVVTLLGYQKPFAFLNSKFNEMEAKVSPNGQWLVYVSDETNRNEVYLQTFPKQEGKIQVSSGGGDFPLWSRDGKELYYVGADRKLMTVEIEISGDTIQPGRAKALFPLRVSPASAGYAYDVAKGGRFLIPTPVEQSNVPFTVVLNWTAGLKEQP